MRSTSVMLRCASLSLCLTVAALLHAQTIKDSSGAVLPDAQGNINTSAPQLGRKGREGIPPPATVTQHLPDAIYWDALRNTSIPVATLVSLATHAQGETDAASLARGSQFLGAGGFDWQEYTDIAFRYDCNPPFTEPAGTCPVTANNLMPLDDSGTVANHYLHQNDSGNPMTRAVKGGCTAYPCQVGINNGNAEVLAIFHKWTATFPGTSVFCDDANPNPYWQPFPSFNYDDLYYYGYFTNEFGPALNTDTPTQAEITTRENAIAAMENASAQPCVTNGGANPSLLSVTFRKTNAVGDMIEYAWVEPNGNPTTPLNGPNGDNYDGWTLQHNFIIAATRLRKYIFEFEVGTTPTTRAYHLANYFLTYNDPYTVTFDRTTLGDSVGLMPEYRLIPTHPVQTAYRSISELCVAPGGCTTTSGLYRREFSACYVSGVNIGGCAAIVNTGTGDQAWPSLKRTYSQTLVFGSTPMDQGGTATFSSGIPSSIPAGTGYVVSQ